MMKNLWNDYKELCKGQISFIRKHKVAYTIFLIVAGVYGYFLGKKINDGILSQDIEYDVYCDNEEEEEV